MVNWYEWLDSLKIDILKKKPTKTVGIYVYHMWFVHNRQHQLRVNRS